MTGAPTNDRDDAWWDGQFADRARPCPFFVDSPDENLAGWLDEGLLPPGRALELGCGNGRNAVHLAILGHVVDAVDFSASAVAWARERAAAADVSIHVQHCSIFDAELADGQYDLVYDSGCFHHLMPDERAAYLALVTRALAPGGRFGLVCFRPEGGAATPTRTRWSAGAPVAGSRTRPSSCAPCGTGRRSRSTCCGRCGNRARTNPPSARSSSGRSWRRNEAATVDRRAPVR